MADWFVDAGERVSLETNTRRHKKFCPLMPGVTQCPECTTEPGEMITVMIIEGVGHDPPAPKELQATVDFVLQQVAADSPQTA